MVTEALKVVEKEDLHPRLTEEVTITEDRIQFLIHAKTGQGDFLLTINVPLIEWENYLYSNILLQRLHIKQITATAFTRTLGNPDIIINRLSTFQVSDRQY